jgi:DNA-binding GntR family transcriptional regulator
VVFEEVLMARKSKPAGPKPTLTEKAYHSIKRAILLGTIGEGTFLSESEIRRTFGIGRTPFREACNRLHNEQFLEVVPHRGYFVPELSFRTVHDLFEVRLVLEGAIAELAALRAKPDQLKELEAAERLILLCTDSSNDYEEVVKKNSDFHLCLAKMTQNRELVELARRILEHTERLSYLEYRGAGYKKQMTRKLHGPILEAIRKRDPAAARKAVLNDITQAQVLTSGVPPEVKPPYMARTNSRVR